MAFDRPWEEVDTDGVTFGEVQMEKPVDLGSPWNQAEGRIATLLLSGHDPSVVSTRRRNVVIEDAVWQRMILHAKKQPNVEVGGFLLGSVWQDDSDEGESEKGVWIQSLIQAEFQESTPASLRFTHDTWQAVIRNHQSSPSAYTILGWYHTHPNWGIFLSSMDQFICRNYFSSLDHVALVIDPQRDMAGCFEWDARGEELLPRNSVYLRQSLEQHDLRSESYGDDSHGPTT